MIMVKSEVFLATTALEDFWDTSKQVVFLGEWCRRYSRSASWAPLNAAVLPTPWNNREKLENFYNYVNEIYESLLEVLSRVLNEIHCLNYSKRYWRILIGTWLYYYICIIYEKYSLIKTGMERYPGFITIGLSESSFVVARDMHDFVQFLTEDSYNLQLYTKILKAIGTEFPVKDYKLSNKPLGSPRHIQPIELHSKRFLRKIVRIIEHFFHDGRPVIMKSSYFPRTVELSLILRAKGELWCNNSNLLELPQKPLDLNLRSRLKDLPLGTSEFEGLLVGILPQEIPQSYVENFPEIQNYALKKYPKKPKAIFTSNAWCFDEVFKHWSASCSENGTILLGCQHGGSYGSITLFPTQDNEFLITDRFYSWGWVLDNYKDKITPMPAPILINRRTFKADNKKKGILLGGGYLPRHFYLFPYFTNNFIQYLDWQTRFLSSLTKEMRFIMRIRLHRLDAGWDFKQRIKENFPEIKLESWDIAFLKSLNNCRIYVCDNLLTTFIEALSANKPTILFWNPETNILNSEALPYYEELRKAGILYYDPEKAAESLNSVYDNVEKWWNEPARQEAREKFCVRFAKVSPNGIKEWVDEFKRIINN